jgi:hypothetical protein
MLLRITGRALRADCSEVVVEFDQWIGLDDRSGTDLLRKLQIVGVVQWRTSSQPTGRLTMVLHHAVVPSCIRLVKHVLFQHFPEATIQAMYPR